MLSCTTVCNLYLAPHTSNPLSVPQGYVDSYSTLGPVEGGNSVKGQPDEGYYDTAWLTGLLSTQAKVEGIVLKAARNWSNDCSVVKDPLGKPGCTLMYVGLPSAWGSVDCDQMYSVLPFLGIRKDMRRRAQGMDITLCGGPAGKFGRGLVDQRLEKALEMDMVLHRGLVKNHGGGSVHREI